MRLDPAGTTLQRPAHAEVAADDDAAVEFEQEVLAHGARRDEPAPVHQRRDRRAARMRRLRRHFLSHQHLKAACGPMERVALGDYVPPGRMQSASRSWSRTSPRLTM